MITLTREEAQQVLDGLRGDSLYAAKQARETLRARLAQPEPEPVAWMMLENKLVPIHTAPPQREWQGLTDAEVKEIYTATEIKVDENWRTGDRSMMFPTTLYKAIEAKLKEKNT